MKLRYTADNATVPKPYVKIVMCGQRWRVKIDALIDSGSDHNVISMDWVKPAGIDLKNAIKVKIAGFNSSKKEEIGYLVPVKYILNGYEWIGDTGFADVNKPHALLGQVGFFDAFNITFSYNQKIITLNPTKTQLLDEFPE